MAVLPYDNGFESGTSFEAGRKEDGPRTPEDMKRFDDILQRFPDVSQGRGFAPYLQPGQFFMDGENFRQYTYPAPGHMNIDTLSGRQNGQMWDTATDNMQRLLDMKRRMMAGVI